MENNNVNTPEITPEDTQKKNAEQTSVKEGPTTREQIAKTTGKVLKTGVKVTGEVAIAGVKASGGIFGFFAANIKAIAIARGFVAPSGMDLVCVPAFTDIDIDGEQKTAIKLIIEPR